MLKQIKQLSALQLCNLFGINEMRYTKDPKKKRQFWLLAGVWLLLILMLIGYMTMIAMSYMYLGLGEIIPVYLFALTSVFILCFSFFKAGSVIFQMSTYEMLMALPVSKAAIVISRFMTMYVTNLVMGVVIMLPGSILYAIGMKPSATFYLYSILGTVLLPILPITIATAIGAMITAISARMRHKSLIASGLSIILLVGFLSVNTRFASSMENMTEAMMRDLAMMITDQIERIYPPAIWYGQGVVQGDMGAFLGFAALTVVVFGGMIFVLQHYFMTICSALNATSARNNYTMQSLKTRSVVKALCQKEIKRYFASSIYVTNTIIGYLLMAIAAVAMMLVGVEKMEEMMQLPAVLGRIVPFAMSTMAVMMPITSCSISLEGKNWWIAQTIPVRSQDIFNGKILANLIIAAPFYVVAVICNMITLRGSVMEMVWAVIIPACYIVYSAIVGITINLALPVLNWDNEVRVVKQSASTMVAMLVGVVSAIIPIVVLIVMPGINVHLVSFIMVGVISLLSFVLYHHNNKRSLLLN